MDIPDKFETVSSIDKRFWTEEEDEKLVGILIDLTNSGKYNADCGFKPGHYQHVERLLAEALPDSKLKANPHIASRMKLLKKHFNVVHDMLTGPNCSGFGYDDSTGCLVAEKAVWEPYLKSHKEAKMFKNKPFSHYKQLCSVWERSCHRN